MPIVLLKKLLLRKVWTVASISVFVLLGCIYFTEQNELNSRKAISIEGLEFMFVKMNKESTCAWHFLNIATLFWLILLGRHILWLTFGKLTDSEQQHIRDFWIFIIYKFTVIRIRYTDGLFLLCFLYLLVGFLHVLTKIAKDRFEYQLRLPKILFLDQTKLLILLNIAFNICGVLFLSLMVMNYHKHLIRIVTPAFKFVLIEIDLLILRKFYIYTLYYFNVYDLYKESDDEVNIDFISTLQDKKRAVAHYFTLIFELVVLTRGIVFLWYNILEHSFLTLMDMLINYVQMVYLQREIWIRCKKQKKYTWSSNFEQNASRKELANYADICAICWEKMEEAHKLPCQHLFHSVCLQTWLKQRRITCPTCRKVLVNYQKI